MAMPPMFFMPAILHFAWVFLVLRTGLALVAGWGLMERAPWGRIVAIVAAFPLQLFKYPLRNRHGHLDPDPAARLPQLDALRATDVS